MVAARQREPHKYSMCCLRTFCAFLRVIIIFNPCASYTILLCFMSSKLLPYHINKLFITIALSSNRKVDGSRLTGSTQACHS